MGKSRKIVVIALAALTLAGAATMAIRTLDRSPRQLSIATVLPKPLTLPDFRLSDQDGRSFTRESFLTRHTLVFFGFTHCPDICPATLQQLAAVRRKLDSTLTGGRDLPDILLISVDPDRDTSQALQEYVSHFGSGVKAASGEIGELKKLTSVLGIYFEKSGGPGEDYNVNHSAAVLLVNRSAEFTAVFSAPIDIDAMYADLLLLTES